MRERVSKSEREKLQQALETDNAGKPRCNSSGGSILHPSAQSTWPLITSCLHFKVLHVKRYCVMSQYKQSNGGGGNTYFIHFIGAAAIAVKMMICSLLSLERCIASMPTPTDRINYSYYTIENTVHIYM